MQNQICTAESHCSCAEGTTSSASFQCIAGRHFEDHDLPQNHASKEEEPSAQVSQVRSQRGLCAKVGQQAEEHDYPYSSHVAEDLGPTPE
ncbi:hypothetical protein GN956_G5045 [Arapaima gigas]